METTLSTNPITHAIVTPAGTHHLISRQTHSILDQAHSDDMVELDDGTQVKLTMATIILPLDEYYTQFPTKRPHDYGQQYTRIESLPAVGMGGVIHQVKRKSHLEAMIAGFKRTSKNPDNPLLKKMELKLKQLNYSNK